MDVPYRDVLLGLLSSILQFVEHQLIRVRYPTSEQFRQFASSYKKPTLGTAHCLFRSQGKSELPLSVIAASAISQDKSQRLLPTREWRQMHERFCHITNISAGTESQKDIRRKRMNTDSFLENFSQTKGVTPGYKGQFRRGNTDPESTRRVKGPVKPKIKSAICKPTMYINEDGKEKIFGDLVTRGNRRCRDHGCIRADMNLMY